MEHQRQHDWPLSADIQLGDTLVPDPRSNALQEIMVSSQSIINAVRTTTTIACLYPD